jgi:Cd2+/Zn2+-exporting ATPase
VHHHSHEHKQQQQQQRVSSSPSPDLMPMPVAQLQAGVLVLVRPGDKVPVDGTIEAGTSVLDESMVTGESKPVTKSVGQAVLAGTVNSGSTAFKVRATAAAGDSTVARLAALMEAAAASKSRHDMAVEAFAKYYTPLVVLVALLTVVLGAALQPAEWRHWAYLSLVVLVTGCPCALVISTPVASVAGLTRAARRVSNLYYLQLVECNKCSA